MMLNVCVFTAALSLLQKQLPSDLSCSVLCSARLAIILHVLMTLCSVILTWLWYCIYRPCGMFLLSLTFFSVCF